MRVSLDRTSDGVAAQAARADVDLLVRAVDAGLDLADVGLELAVRLAVRVRDVKAERYALAADVAFRHGWGVLLYFIFLFLSMRRVFARMSL